MAGVPNRRQSSGAPSGARKFIIWAPSFDDGVGGIIALHLLCKRLNEAGETAMLWPAWRPALTRRSSFRDILRRMRWQWRSRKGASYETAPFGNPLARSADLEGAIVIYPELVTGNPLRSERVVRWLLHKPGFHSGQINFGEHDLFFHYQEAFENPTFPSRRLTLTWINETYRDLGFMQRSGSTYMLRKGKGRRLVHNLSDSVCVDDMSHEARATIFNRTKYFYCYDLYTMYASYAAVCGSIPIVVPEAELSKEAWVPDERDRYGIAYGMDDIPWALATRDSLLLRIAQVREEQDLMLRDFVHTCQEAFCG